LFELLKPLDIILHYKTDYYGGQSSVPDDGVPEEAEAEQQQLVSEVANFDEEPASAASTQLSQASSTLSGNMLSSQTVELPDHLRKGEFCRLFEPELLAEDCFASSGHKVFQAEEFVRGSPGCTDAQLRDALDIEADAIALLLDYVILVFVGLLCCVFSPSLPFVRF